ncbi:hypothetical protein K2Y11_01410, partial [bacterium]|nr:hypothetical protein [bacterium]
MNPRHSVIYHFQARSELNDMQWLFNRIGCYALLLPFLSAPVCLAETAVPVAPAATAEEKAYAGPITELRLEP